MKKLLILIPILWLLCTSPGLSQTTIKGKVVDSRTGDPLIGATIHIAETNFATMSDWDGTFALETELPLPLTLFFTYVGYEREEVLYEEESTVLLVSMRTQNIQLEGVVIRGDRLSEKQKSAPLTVESFDLAAIKETASNNFYDGLGALKGVDITAASLGFKIVNTRGFNSTSPVRSLQIIDGVDNQAPGLNFSLGNFLGSSELDVNKVDIVAGASSAYYGPNAFNGVISLETKDPFFF